MAKDAYANLAYMNVTESAANTLTFNGLTVVSNILANNAMLIHRVEYTVAVATLNEIAADGDTFTFGLTGSNTLTTTLLDDPEVYDEQRLCRQDAGTAGNAIVYRMPLVADWSQMPGGGRLVPADRIFVFAEGTAMGNPGEITARVYFTIIDMTPADYLELAQSLRVLR